MGLSSTYRAAVSRNGSSSMNGTIRSLLPVRAPALPEAEHARVTAVDLADRPCQAIGRLRNRDQVDMIGHQAIRPDLDRVGATP
jgi:hypothetical protein